MTTVPDSRDLTNLFLAHVTFQCLHIAYRNNLRRPDQKLPLEAFLCVSPVSVLTRQHNFMLLSVSGLWEEQPVIHSLTKGSNCSSYPHVKWFSVFASAFPGWSHHGEGYCVSIETFLLWISVPWCSPAPQKCSKNKVQVSRSISLARNCRIFKICLKMKIFICMLMLKSRCFKVLKFLLNLLGLEKRILKCELR